MQCINCGRNLFGHERFCPDCGTSADAGATQAPNSGSTNPGGETRVLEPGQQTMVPGTGAATAGSGAASGGPACPWCGAATIPGLRFCENCGGSLLRDSSVAATSSGGGGGIFGSRWLAIGGIAAVAAAVALIGGWCVAFGGDDDSNLSPDPVETTSPTPDETPSPSPQSSPSPRPSPSPGATPSPSPEASPSPSPSASASASPSASRSPTSTSTNTATATRTNTPTATRPGTTPGTNTATATRTNTPTATTTRTNTPTATATRTNTPTATPTATRVAFSVTASFQQGTYHSGDTAEFCWTVSSASTTYAFTVSEVSPGSGTIDSGSGQVGGQCRAYQINSEFTGTVTLEVSVSPTGGSPSSARASASVIAPPSDLTHISASLDSGHYVPGDVAQFCWNASESGVAYTYDVYVATYFWEDGSGTGGQTYCTYVDIIEDDAYAGSITVEIYAFAGGIQVYASATAQVSHSS